MEMIITKENFKQEVMNCDKPVLLDFWASWCGPCKMIAPVVEEIANDHVEIKVGKVNVDEQPELASAFGVSSIPTIVVIKDGKISQSSVGYRTKEQLEALL